MAKDSKQTADLTLAYLALRFYIGLQLLLAGLDKFMADGKFGGFSAYKENMLRIADGIAGASIMPAWLSKPYALLLPWALLLCGIAVLVGIKNRIALFAAAVVYTSLSIGLGPSCAKATVL